MENITKMYMFIDVFMVNTESLMLKALFCKNWTKCE